MGRVLTNYSLLTMEFVYEGNHMVLNAEHLLKPDPMTRHALRNLIPFDANASVGQLQLFNYARRITGAIGRVKNERMKGVYFGKVRSIYTAVHM